MTGPRNGVCNATEDLPALHADAKCGRPTWRRWWACGTRAVGTPCPKPPWTRSTAPAWWAAGSTGGCAASQPCRREWACYVFQGELSPAVARPPPTLCASIYPHAPCRPAPVRDATGTTAMNPACADARTTRARLPARLPARPPGCPPARPPAVA